MQSKKYTAKTIKDAIALVKEDLGAGAVILDTRKLPVEYGSPVGMNGLLFEVTAVSGQETEHSEIFPMEKSYFPGSAGSISAKLSVISTAADRFTVLRS